VNDLNDRAKFVTSVQSTGSSNLTSFKEKRLEDDNKGMRDLVAKLNQKLKEKESEIKILKKKV